ncbi:putative transcription factor C2H2 family [Lupinus albus]|uniref:Putative transcription factor C2H2 family n=1 Tax=Lupinus albus TaxID=3870 RepID=A0A6A4PDZ3_LUPAL|nr:putative transcription factor C2H2 family [Lupinus albus]
MAVEASNYMNLLPSHQTLLTNRETMKSNHQQQHHLLNSTLYNAQVDSTPMVLPEKMAQTFMPFYQSNNVCDPNRADSGLTCHNIIPLQRKRSRDFTTELISLPPHQKNKLSPQSSYLDQDIFFHIQNQHQSEIDHVLAHHAEKVRMELGEQKMRQSRMLLGTIQEVTAKKLREKDEEIQRIQKMNMALQEKVKSLYVENQIWRELAQTNETTANNLRSNLEQVLAHVSSDHHVVMALADDAQSSCGSNGVAENREDTAASVAVGGGRNMCKNCGVRESIVLLLPCRHLSLCTICGSTIHNCPVCDSGMDASVHVNLSY